MTKSFFFKLKHIGFKDGGEWSLFLRTECPDALLAYATAQRYQLVLHVIHIGTRGAEEIKFYPHGQSQDNEDKHVFVAYLVDNTFLPLVPMEASGKLCKQLLVNITQKSRHKQCFFPQWFPC